MNWATTGIAAGAVSTSVMTLFSYTASKIAKENFSEPDLLSSMFHERHPSLKKSTSHVIGWQAHYALGLGLSLLYGTLKIKNQALSSTLWFGCLSGVTGIFIWKKAFDLNPKAVETDYKKFYLQLFFSHLVFGFTLRKSYSLLED